MGLSSASGLIAATQERAGQTQERTTGGASSTLARVDGGAAQVVVHETSGRGLAQFRVAAADVAVVLLVVRAHAAFVQNERVPVGAPAADLLHRPGDERVAGNDQRHLARGTDAQGQDSVAEHHVDGDPDVGRSSQPSTDHVVSVPPIRRAGLGGSARAQLAGSLVGEVSGRNVHFHLARSVDALTPGLHPHVIVHSTVTRKSVTGEGVCPD